MTQGRTALIEDTILMSPRSCPKQRMMGARRSRSPPYNLAIVAIGF